MVTITEDGKLEIKGDHISYTNLRGYGGTLCGTQKALKVVADEMPT